MNDTAALLPHVRLRFNIEHPSFEESYAFGYDCALAEISESENPYPVGSSAHEQWLEGWWDGFYGVESLYKSDSMHQDAEKKNVVTQDAANDKTFLPCHSSFLINVLKITGAIAASALVGYQLLDLVA